MRFAVVSDPHFGNPARLVTCPIQAFVTAVATSDFGVVTGDLTDAGYDGTVTCGCLFPLLGANNAVSGGSLENQLAEFVAAVIEPIQRVGKTVYLVPGNHDQYNGASRHPVNDYIARAHGCTHYAVRRGGILLLFCDVYPSAAVLAWMKGELRSCGTEPVLLFFHYNFTGPFGDWWTDAEKEAFRLAITGVRVLGIFVGHRHESYAETWNGYAVYSTAGSTFAVCEATTEAGGRLSVTFTK